jgi:TolB-like protein
MKKLKPYLITMYMLFMFGYLGCNQVKGKVYINPNANFRFIKKVAVLPFENLSQDRYAGKKMRDIFVTTLLASEVVDVPELGEVQQVMNTIGMVSQPDQPILTVREQEPTGTITRDTARALGQALGIQGIIIGSVEEYGIVRGMSGSYPEVSLTLRMIDPKTGSIIWAVSHTEKGSRILPSILGIGEETLTETAFNASKEITDTLVYK